MGVSIAIDACGVSAIATNDGIGNGGSSQAMVSFPLPPAMVEER